MYQCKGNGMAAKVFAEQGRIQQLPGYMGKSSQHALYLVRELTVMRPRSSALSDHGNVICVCAVLGDFALSYIN